MQYFTRLTRLLVAGLGLTLALPALAAGTDAGVMVTNAVTLDYQVNGGDQPQLTDEVTFVVDRKLDVLVTTADADWVTVTTGQENTGVAGDIIPALNYTVTNNSNDAVDVVLGVVNQGAVAITGFTGTPAADFDTDGFIVVQSGDGNATYDVGTDTLIPPNASGFYELPLILDQDDSVIVHIVADVAASALADDYEAFTLVAGVASAPGLPIPRDDSGNVAAGIDPSTGTNNPDNPAGPEQTVFADFVVLPVSPEDVGFDFFVGFDSSGGPDVNYDGQSSDTSGFIVAGVNVEVAKYAEVIYDPVSGNKYDVSGNAIVDAEPKAIPGAVIMYLIGVANQDTVFDADGLAIADDVPVGPVLLGDASPAADDVYYPVNVTVDYDLSSPGSNTEAFVLPAPNSGTPLDLGLVNTVDCADIPATAAFAGSPPEVAVPLGTCAAGTSAYVVYFVTVDAG